MYQMSSSECTSMVGVTLEHSATAKSPPKTIKFFRPVQVYKYFTVISVSNLQ